ncbi:MAG: hypothetical protein ACTIJ9_14410 [Aequorivita sp.]
MATPKIEMLPFKTMQGIFGYDKVTDQIGLTMEAMLDNGRQF